MRAFGFESDPLVDQTLFIGLPLLRGDVFQITSRIESIQSLGRYVSQVSAERRLFGVSEMNLKGKFNINGDRLLSN